MKAKSFFGALLIVTGMFVPAFLSSGEKIKGVYVLEAPELLMPGVKSIAILDFESRGTYAWHRSTFGQDFSNALVDQLSNSRRGIEPVCIKKAPPWKWPLLIAMGRDICEEYREGVTYQRGAYTNIFNLTERSQLNAILKEAGLTVEGLIDENTAIRLGKLLQVQALVMGTLRYDYSTKRVKQERSDDRYVWCEKRVFTIRANVRFVSTETGSILGTANIKKEIEDEDCPDRSDVQRSIDDVLQDGIVSLSGLVASHFAPTFVAPEYELEKIKEKRFKKRGKAAEELVKKLKLEEAYCIYKKINDEDEYLHRNLYNLGVLNEIAGNFTVARQFYEDALSLEAGKYEYERRLRKMDQIIAYLEKLQMIGVNIEMHPLSTCDSRVTTIAGRVKTKGKRKQRWALYTEPVKNSKVVARIPGELTLEFTEKRGSWYKVKVKRKTGWIHKDNVTEK